MQDPSIKSHRSLTNLLLSNESPAALPDSNYFRRVKNPGGNNYAISAVASALIRGELLAALLELKGGFEVHIHFLRQGLDRMRGAITESLGELQLEVRTLLENEFLVTGRSKASSRARVN